MIAERESAGYLLGETVRLLRVNVGLALAALGVMTLLSIAADLYPDFVGLSLLGSVAATLVLQHEISSAILIQYDLIDGRTGRRLAALLGLNLLSGIAILFGLIVLIIPGAYLFVRWSAAAPALIAEDAGISESLSRSAHAVQGRFWHVFAALLVVWTPSLVAGFAAVLLVPEEELLIASLALNIPINLSLIAGWHLAVVIYAGRQGVRGLAEVFA